VLDREGSVEWGEVGKQEPTVARRRGARRKNPEAVAGI
jgi:hypothetical protein